MREWLSAEVRKATPELSPPTQARQRARLVEAVGKWEPTARRGWVMASVLAAAACAAALSLWLVAARDSGSGGRGGTQGSERYWSRVAQRTVEQVGDRGELELSVQSTAHLEHRAEQVSVVLNRGEVLSRVTPRRGTQWGVRAGAYLVRAVGTRFRVQYEPAAERLLVRVEEGSVEVSGGQLGVSKVALELGQTLSVVGSRVSIERDGQAGPLNATQLGTLGLRQPALPEPRSAASQPVPPALAPAQSALTQDPDWLELHAAGEHRRALQKAVELGFDGLVGQLDCDKLTELADVARLSRDTARAEQALLSLRGRCLASPGGRRAAFLLGRLKDDANPGEAAGWYERFLAEAAGDRFADQALGRLISAEQRAGRPTRARIAAERYLKLYPGGSYAELAQSLALP